MKKPGLPRIYFIDRKIASGCYPNTHTLAAEYETSKATVERDIAFMKYSLNAPIEYSAKRRGYYYTEPSFRLAAGFAGSRNDILALACMKTLLSLYRDTPLYDTTQELLDVIAAPFDTAPPSLYENRIVIPPMASAPVSREIWSSITTALRENRVVSFEYKGRWDTEFFPRSVRPYQLLFDLGMWYLYGFDEGRNAIRIFSLARMKDVRVLEQSFSLPEDYDYRAGNGQSYFGVFAGSETHHFRVVFYDVSVAWVQERIWAEDQVIEPFDGGVLIDFTSTQYDSVLEWVLSRGCTTRPLEPRYLVNDWMEHIEGMRKRSLDE
jgi:predicted DNA-binding transcriptional regulator YafY